MILIVGSGISGIVLANKIATELNEEVLIIDKRNHIGGNCYDYKDKETGIYVHKYGTHIFHTDSEEIWNYLSQFTKWYPYQHKVIGLIDGQEVPIPFNLNSIEQMFPKQISDKLISKLISTFGFNIKVPILELKKQNDKDLKFLADFIYEKVFLNYTLKQWENKPEELDVSVSNRVPVYISRDNRYFQNKYQGIPLEGYTNMFNKMLNNKLIKVQLNTNYKDFIKKNDIKKFKKIFYTGPIDEYFNYEFGKLPYRSLKFDFLKFDNNYFQSNSVVNYPNNYNWTRIGEYKYFLNQQNTNNKTIIFYEYPKKYEEGINDRYYPIIQNKNIELYNKYLEKTKQLDNIYFLGRLGDYKYYDMDKAIQRALDVFQIVKEEHINTEEYITMNNQNIKTPKVSILVPIYNNEIYLRECIDSIVNQTLKDIEIILLDDGSTDNSSQICDEYAKKDSRIKVIHKENTGYGHTMNLGIQLAKGEYIGIVESDDYVELDMFESLYNATVQNNQKIDIVKSNHTVFYGDKNNRTFDKENKDIHNPKYYHKVLVPSKKPEMIAKDLQVIWSSIYNKSFLIENNIKFNETPGASY